MKKDMETIQFLDGQLAADHGVEQDCEVDQGEYVKFSV